MVVQDLVVAWEKAYSRYETAMGDDVTETSRAVAGAWHELAAHAELPWWLSAAVRTAAQAFEHQAEDWAADEIRHAAAVTGTADDDNEEDDGGDEEPAVTHKVVLPTQQGPRKSCACHQVSPSAGSPPATVTVVRVPA